MIKINNLLQIDEDLSSLLKFVYLRGSRTALGQVGFTARNIHNRRIRASITGAAGIQFIPSTFELDPGQARSVLLNVSDVAFLETLPVGTTAVDFKVAVNEILPTVILLPEPVIPGIPPAPALVLGCLDPQALNYNASANMSDGSCTYAPTLPAKIRGCTSRTAKNYNPYATEEDGSCIVEETFSPPPPPVYGCKDPAATNYNPTATVNTGCTYPPATRGCTNARAINYNSQAQVDDGSCILPGRWVLLQIANAYQTSRTVITQRSDENFQEGSAANNFVRGYYYTEYGYSETTYYGAQYEYQLEGDAQTAGTRPANPTREISTERGDVNIITNRFLRGPDAVFVVCNEIGKVTKEFAYPIGTFRQGYKNVCRLIQNSIAPGGCLESCEDEFVGVYGCTNPAAQNYNPSATLDDNSCMMAPVYCNMTDVTTSCSDILGNTFAGTAQRTVNVLVNGQTTPLGCISYPNVPSQWDTSACVKVQSPPADIFGCTDSTAINYNPYATRNDNSCQYQTITTKTLVYGCTDSVAINYNPLANREDNSCQYQSFGGGGGGGGVVEDRTNTMGGGAVEQQFMI